MNRSLPYFFLFATTASAAPEWATRNTLQLAGSTLTVVCSGQGPSIDLARSQAIASCQATATRQSQTDVNVKTLSVETETGVGFHQEVTTGADYSNLKCNPIQEEIEPSESSYTLWLKCRFNLGKVMSKNLKEPQKDTILVGKDLVQVSISTVPKCTSIIVKGKKSRIEACSTNPFNLNLDKDDREITIRADGFRPLTINTNILKEKPTFQTTLEPL